MGADFYKVPRATAMRTLSRVRKSIVWIFKVFFADEGCCGVGARVCACGVRLRVLGGGGDFAFQDVWL